MAVQPFGTTVLDDGAGCWQAVVLPALSPIDGNANFARIVGQVGRWGLCLSALYMLLYTHCFWRVTHVQLSGHVMSDI
jgi:hypothetical protein